MSDGWFPGRSVKLEQPDKKYDIGIYVGEDLETCRKENILKLARLQIHVSDRHEGDAIAVTINGQPLPMSEATTDSGVIRFDLSEVLPKVGHNIVSIVAKKFGSDVRPVVTRVELMVEHDISGILWKHELAKQAGN